VKLFGVEFFGGKRGPDLIDGVTPERRDEILDYLAGKIHDYGMTTPAIIVLESHRPISYIASQFVHFIAPFGDVLVGSPYASELGYVMEDRENITRLVERLEALTREDDARMAKAKEAVPDEPEESEKPEEPEDPEERDE